MIETDALLAERLSYTVAKALPLSEFLAWPESDQDLTLAYLRLQKRKCPGCGLRDEDLADPAHPRYIADVHTCLGCMEMAQVQEQIPEKQRPASRVFWIPAELYVPPDMEGLTDGV
jgi:hypothetical protein